MKKLKSGFTLAEVLTALTLIGVVAALTTPMLTKTVQRHTAGPTVARVVEQVEAGCQALIQYENSRRENGSYISNLSEVDNMNLTKLSAFIGGAPADEEFEGDFNNFNAYLSEPLLMPAAYAARWSTSSSSSSSWGSSSGSSSRVLTTSSSSSSSFGFSSSSSSTSSTGKGTDTIINGLGNNSLQEIQTTITGNTSSSGSATTSSSGTFDPTYNGDDRELVTGPFTYPDGPSIYDSNDSNPWADGSSSNNNGGNDGGGNDDDNNNGGNGGGENGGDDNNNGGNGGGENGGENGPFDNGSEALNNGNAGNFIEVIDAAGASNAGGTLALKKTSANIVIPELNLNITEPDDIFAVIDIDTNGVSRGPNTYGRDVFRFNLTNRGKMVPEGNNNADACADGNIGDGRACSARLVRDGFKIKY